MVFWERHCLPTWRLRVGCVVVGDDHQQTVTATAPLGARQHVDDVDSVTVGFLKRKRRTKKDNIEIVVGTFGARL